MPNELKPCPFCGGEVSMTYSSFYNTFNIYHKNGLDEEKCCVCDPVQLKGELRSLAMATEVWNRRVDNV